jgi:hypothetical protein
MKIDFDDGEAGFFEARAVLAVVEAARLAELDIAARDFLDFLSDSATTHVQRGEFSKLREAHGTGADVWPSFSVLKQFWRRTVGPSNLESSLSQQRSEALERAERAEHSAFEALAETAKVARERDQASAEAARLRREVDALEAERIEKGLVQTGE